VEQKQLADIRTKYAKEFAKRLTETLGESVKTVILYGSLARGEVGEESDVDILVIIEDTPEEARIKDEILKIAYEIDYESGFRAIISPISLTLKEFTQRLEAGSPFIYNALKDAIILHDNGLRDIIKRHIEISEKFLQSSKLLLREGYVRSAIDRAYYSMYHAAQAALIWRGVTPPKTHSGLVAKFGEELIQSGICSKELGRYLSNAMKKRISGTYEVESEPEEETALKLIKNAEIFLKKVKELVNLDSPPI